MKSITLQVILIAVIFLNSAFSQDLINQEVKFPDATVNKLDSIVAHIKSKNNLPGVAVGIWIPGEGEYTSAIGSADLNTKLHRDINSQFRIASITKTFIATAILKLISEGRLSKVDNMRATVLLGKPTSVAISVKLMPSLCLEMVFRISKARRTERMSSDIIFLIL